MPVWTSCRSALRARRARRGRPARARRPAAERPGRGALDVLPDSQTATCRWPRCAATHRDDWERLIVAFAPRRGDPRRTRVRAQRVHGRRRGGSRPPTTGRRMRASRIARAARTRSGFRRGDIDLAGDAWNGDLATLEPARSGWSQPTAWPPRPQLRPGGRAALEKAAWRTRARATRAAAGAGASRTRAGAPASGRRPTTSAPVSAEAPGPGPPGAQPARVMPSVRVQRVQGLQAAPRRRRAGWRPPRPVGLNGVSCCTTRPSAGASALHVGDGEGVDAGRRRRRPGGCRRPSSGSHVAELRGSRLAPRYGVAVVGRRDLEHRRRAVFAAVNGPAYASSS